MDSPTAFLSHSSEDKAPVRAIAKGLRSRNIDVWLDEEQILLGDSIVGKIEQGIAESDAIVVCISKSFVASSWCRKEYHSAIAREINLQRTVVLPLRLDEEEPPELLKDKASLSIADGLNEDSLSQLVAAIEAARSATRVFRMRPGPMRAIASQTEKGGIVCTELTSHGSNLAMIIRSVVADFPIRGLSDESLLNGANLFDLYSAVDRFIEQFQHLCDEVIDVVKAGKPLGYGSAMRAGRDRIAGTNRRLLRIAEDMRGLSASLASILDESSNLRDRISKVSMLCTSISLIEDWLVLRVGAPDEIKVEERPYGTSLPGSLPHWVAPEEIANLPIYNETSGMGRFDAIGHEQSIREFESLLRLLDQYRQDLRGAIATMKTRA